MTPKHTEHIWIHLCRFSSHVFVMSNCASPCHLWSYHKGHQSKTCSNTNIWIISQQEPNSDKHQFEGGREPNQRCAGQFTNLQDCLLTNTYILYIYYINKTTKSIFHSNNSGQWHQILITTTSVSFSLHTYVRHIKYLYRNTSKRQPIQYLQLINTCHGLLDFPIAYICILNPFTTCCLVQGLSSFNVKLKII